TLASKGFVTGETFELFDTDPKNATPLCAV
ncbi:MBL fold metallo-hydrolase, partial [Bacillus vallismortis]|nr:MBL fold metallo-hydrolase [Bacillus vallismortis]